MYEYVCLCVHHLFINGSNLDVFRFASKCMTKHCQNGVFHTSSVRRQIFSFQNSSKNLDPSCKMDLELQNCLGMVKLVL